MEGFILLSIIFLSCLGTVFGIYEWMNGFHSTRTRVMLLRTSAFSIGALVSLVILILMGVIK